MIRFRLFGISGTIGVRDWRLGWAIHWPISVRFHRHGFRLGLAWYRWGVIVRISGGRFRVFGKREHRFHCEELGICICHR